MELQGAALVASLKREVTEAEDAFNKQILETTSLKKEYAVEVQNLNEQNRNLQEQNNEVSLQNFSSVIMSFTPLCSL